MKLILALSIFVCGCSNYSMHYAHQSAKIAERDNMVFCYEIYEPKELIGKYCLSYENPDKPWSRDHKVIDE